MSPPELAKRAKLETWFREGPKTSLRDLPHPRDDKNRKLPHGAKLDRKLPIQLHSRKALIWWLRLRNMNIPGNYPLNSLENEHGGKEPGLVDLVRRVLNAKNAAPCMTLEEVRSGMCVMSMLV